MSIKEQYKIINDILWGLKPFELRNEIHKQIEMEKLVSSEKKK